MVDSPAEKVDKISPSYRIRKHLSIGLVSILTSGVGIIEISEKILHGLSKGIWVIMREEAIDVDILYLVVHIILIRLVLGSIWHGDKAEVIGFVSVSVRIRPILIVVQENVLSLDILKTEVKHLNIIGVFCEIYRGTVKVL